MKVGDIIWIRSTDWAGSYYQHLVIVGETSRSWIVKSAHPEHAWALTSTWSKGTKIPKTLKGWELGTKEQAEQKSWAVANVYRISQKVACLNDPILISKIAALIGYMEA